MRSSNALVSALALCCVYENSTTEISWLSWCADPITGIARCCARAASGHATAAPPRAASNFRRPMVTVIRHSRARCVKGMIPRHERVVFTFKEAGCWLLPPLLLPPTLGERHPIGLAHRLLAVRRRVVLMLAKGQRPHPRRTNRRGVKLEDVADDGGIGEHVEIVVVPFAQWARRAGLYLAIL